MRRTAELAERLDVRLHTHLAEDPDEDMLCMEQFGCRPLEYFEDVGWGASRAWVAHCVHPNAEEIVRLGQSGTGVAHCPSWNLLLGVGLCPVHKIREAGVPVAGCDGSSSTDSASLWMEARNTMLIGRAHAGRPARDRGAAGAEGDRHTGAEPSASATSARSVSSGCARAATWPWVSTA